MMDDGDVPRRSAKYRPEDFGDEVVLYDPAATRVVYLNDTASLIWRLCDGQRNIADIKTLLQEGYPAASDQIREDLRATLHQFVWCGVVWWSLYDHQRDLRDQLCRDQAGHFLAGRRIV